MTIQERLRLVAARIAPLPRRTEMWATPLERYIDDIRDAYMVLREAAAHIDKLTTALRQHHNIEADGSLDHADCDFALAFCLGIEALLSPQGTETAKGLFECVVCHTVWHHYDHEGRLRAARAFYEHRVQTGHSYSGASPDPSASQGTQDGTFVSQTQPSAPQGTDEEQR